MASTGTRSLSLRCAELRLLKLDAKLVVFASPIDDDDGGANKFTSPADIDDKLATLLGGTGFKFSGGPEPAPDVWTPGVRSAMILETRCRRCDGVVYCCLRIQCEHEKPDGGYSCKGRNRKERNTLADVVCCECSQVKTLY